VISAGIFSMCILRTLLKFPNFEMFLQETYPATHSDEASGKRAGPFMKLTAVLGFAQVLSELC
jgi:hypothetical protein